MRLPRILSALLLVGLVVSFQAAGAPSTEKRAFRDHPSRQKITICHCPGGNPDNCKTITVGAPAVRAHLGHGDSIGACGVPTGRETACCLPDGCQEQVAPAQCRRMGGAPFGLCASCADVTCPDSRCIGATGSCNAAHSTPGCDNLYCCDQICRTNPYCCDVAWDEQCASTLCRITTDERACCSPDGACGVTSSSLCTGNGGSATSSCEGDTDGDGVDDACTCSSP